MWLAHAWPTRGVGKYGEWDAAWQKWNADWCDWKPHGWDAEWQGWEGRADTNTKPDWRADGELATRVRWERIAGCRWRAVVAGKLASCRHAHHTTNRAQ